jgi:hypothetical protein
MIVLAGIVVAVALLRFAAGVRGAGRLADPFAVAGALAPPASREWLEAMRAEQSMIEDPRERGRFARGCAGALLFRSRSADRTTAAMRSVVLATIAVAIALGGFGLLDYPELRTGDWLPYVAGFLAALAVHAALASRLALLGPAQARRIGLLSAVPAAGIAAAAAAAPGAVSLALVYLVLAPPAVAGWIAARRDGRAGSGVVAAGTASVLAGLLAFIGFATATYVSGGGTPTPALLADFHRSGMHDYAAWAVGDNLGGGVFMLALVLVFGAPVGMVVASLAPTRFRARSAPAA